MTLHSCHQPERAVRLMWEHTSLWTKNNMCRVHFCLTHAHLMFWQVYFVLSVQLDKDYRNKLHNQPITNRSFHPIGIFLAFLNKTFLAALLLALWMKPCTVRWVIIMSDSCRICWPKTYSLCLIWLEVRHKITISPASGCLPLLPISSLFVVQ